MDIIEKLRSGTGHHQAGRLNAAEAVYEEILSVCPDHPDALHLSGLVSHQLGNSTDGIRKIRCAVAQQPGNIVYRENLVRVLISSGNLREGLRCCKELIEAIPEAVDMRLLLGETQLQLGQYPAAMDSFLKAVEIDPLNAHAHHNLGVAYQHMGQSDEAVSSFRCSLQINPHLVEAHYNLGNTLRDQSGVNQAVLDAYRTALAINPGYADACFNLAKALDEVARTDEAIVYYQRTLEISPDLTEAHNSLGNAYLQQGRYASAIRCYEQTLRIDPGFHEGYYNLALACKEQGKMRDASEFAEKALSLKPEFGGACSLLVQIYQQSCAWMDLEAACKRLDTVTENELAAGRCPSEQPFLNFTRHTDPETNLRVARAWSRAAATRKGREFTHARPSRSGDKIVIGYVSERFRNAATAHLTAQLFGMHDRRRFKVYAYSYGKDDGSSYRKRIVRDADRFIDIRHMSDLDAAGRIHEDGVDILVDLMGYMKHNRLPIFALRPAPVQVAYLGYPSTTGADFMDYLVADQVVAPAGDQAHFSERLVRLPNCYQINDNAQPVSDRPCHRSDFGLPEEAFVYCSFNTDYKIDRSVFHSWMTILKQVPESVLWLLVRSDETRSNLVHAAGAAGVDPNRIVFAQSLPKHEHLARIRLADLALDTRIVNGHTTTSDCLWAGLPVVAQKGTHLASRVSASLLKAVGLDALVCDDSRSYESLAVALAEDQRRLLVLRKKLAEIKMIEPLFDTAATVQSLEQAYLKIWKNYLNGSGPQPFSVEPHDPAKVDAEQKGK